MRPTTLLHGNCVTIWIYGRRKTRFNFKSLPFPFPEGEENSRTRHNLSLASMSFPGLSKSRLLSSLQCPKRLWLEVNRRELSEYSRADEQHFTIGYNIGEIARQIEPDGVLIGSDENRLLIMNEHKQLGTAAGSPSSHSMNARKRCFTRRSSTAC